mmetsp:Transcript_34767/g.87204  ORF Transcript_34767/g.87204 Transcript_34767/m.87204 type:complete len:207 (-) Transcript_34767:217-837(-)
MVAIACSRGGTGAAGRARPAAASASIVTIWHPCVTSAGNGGRGWPPCANTTKSMTVGQSLRQPSMVGRHARLTHTVVSSAWLQMKRTASGPRVSYSGTETADIRVIPASSRHHSVLLTEYSPMCSPGRRPAASRPEDSAARAAYTCAYVIQLYSPACPSGDTWRVPKAGRSLWRLQVLSHRSCRVLTPWNGGAYPVISAVGEDAFL